MVVGLEVTSKIFEDSLKSFNFHEFWNEELHYKKWPKKNFDVWMLYSHTSYRMKCYNFMKLLSNKVISRSYCYFLQFLYIFLGKKWFLQLGFAKKLQGKLAVNAINPCIILINYFQEWLAFNLHNDATLIRSCNTICALITCWGQILNYDCYLIPVSNLFGHCESKHEKYLHDMSNFIY